MKPKYLTPILILVALGATFSAQAHDPKEHMKDAKKPDCAAMKNMDHSKMNMNDPVMQAMMKKCMKDMQHNESKTDQTQADHQANEGSSGELQSKHQH